MYQVKVVTNHHASIHSYDDRNEALNHAKSLMTQYRVVDVRNTTTDGVLRMVKGEDNVVRMSVITM